MNRKSIRENLNRLEILNKRIESEIIEANRLTSEGVQSYNQAWEDEENEDTESASQRFNDAHNSISQASLLLPLNQSLKNFTSTINFKIEGNSLFNEGVDLLNRANALREKANEAIELGDIQKAEKYLRKAKEKCLEARGKFDEGYRLSQDERFHTCTSIVDETLGPLESAFKSISNQLDANLNFAVDPTTGKASSSRINNNTFYHS